MTARHARLSSRVFRRSKLLALALIAAFGGPAAFGQSQAPADTGAMGPNPALPPPFATPSGLSKTKWSMFQANQAPIVPAGFSVTRFAGALDSPINAIALSNGDVLVAEARTERKNEDPSFRNRGANRIVLLRDADGDGIAEQRWGLMSGLRQPYGMALVGSRLYVADTDGIFWVPYHLGETAVPALARRTRITRFAPGGYNNHWSRNIIASPDGKQLYVAIGSASNAGEFGMTAEIRRANILRISLANGRETLIASGIRNPVGMAFEPDTGHLWTAVNERDGLGEDLVPDYITRVRPGAFYGWPYSYWGKSLDPRVKAQRPDLVATAIAPDFAVGAHVSALAIAFGHSARFSAPWRNGAFVARHGSWNRAAPAGYDVIYVPFKLGHPVGTAKPFLTGFLDTNNVVHGRPRALTVASDGALLVVDDAGGSIWRVDEKPNHGSRLPRGQHR